MSSLDIYKYIINRKKRFFSEIEANKIKALFKNFRNSLLRVLRKKNILILLCVKNKA